jgi:hypothetical protein
MVACVQNRLLIARITRTEYNVWNPIPLLPIAGPLFCTYLSKYAPSRLRNFAITAVGGC